MSLKAKLEAVIYAAEEPVTLAQLAAIFAYDAIAWKSEQAERQAEHDARNLELALVPSSNESDDALENSDSLVEDSSLELAELVEAVEGNAEEAAESTAEPTDPEEQELAARREERRRDREVRDILRGILDDLIADYASEGRGLEIREIAGGFRMGTKPEIHDAVRAFVKSLKPPMKLSLPALETLAVIAYKQPVTAPEVGEIRGVDSAGVLGSLLSRKLIATAGRKQVIGRPILYKTTKEFLVRFGLKDVNELPSMEEFEKMAALELDEESGEDGILDPSEPVERPGNLFTEADEARETYEESNDPDSGAREPEALSPASNELVTETSIPTAEPSQEAAEAYTTVERRHEIEVEQ